MASNNNNNTIPVTVSATFPRPTTMDDNLVRPLTGSQMGVLDYAIAAGLTVGVLTFCFAPISGAHFNPAITLASAIFGHFPWSRVRQFSGFVIGMAIALAVFIAGPISGASMNPARSLGPAIVSWAFDDIWIYITAPCIGAITGAFISDFLRLCPPPLQPSDGKHFDLSSSANAYLIT
ncbi:putative aquaporin NIP7-1 [Cucumis melo var. makuwa]|uniref:Putative aquaporin NIP7-1 n=1 Tax=Cucumis melo var. makuwa TaxID=1194695 RepID=A0A5D3D393_CUCMM|nr:putative aquaporin NIP7-1 [Cucumis melo var. makuwa]